MKEEEGWYGNTMETERQRLDDPATGRPIVLRKIEHKYLPWVSKKPKKSDILTKDYIKHLENLLWADNLEMVQFPKVTFTKTGFTVWATCQAKKGNQLPYHVADQLDKPLHERLQDDEKQKDNG